MLQSVTVKHVEDYKMMLKQHIAKVIRMLSVPPIMISVLVVILAVFDGDVFRNSGEIVVSILLLGFVPVLAYVLQKILPEYKDNGRDGQRKLAFITNLIGYTTAFIWAIVVKAQDGLMILCSTYFLSVIILIIFNKILHIKASGHASSFTGPLILLVYLLDWWLIIPCTVVAILIAWSSIYLKRHTAKELIIGIIVCLISFCVSVLCVTRI